MAPGASPHAAFASGHGAPATSPSSPACCRWSAGCGKPPEPPAPARPPLRPGRWRPRHRHFLHWSAGLIAAAQCKPERCWLHHGHGCCCCCWRNRGREGREFDWSELEMLKLRVVSWRPSAWLAEPEFSPWLTELPCLLSTSRTALGSSLSVCVQWSSAEPPSLRGASTPAPSSAARFSSSPSKESTCWQSLSDFLFATRLIAAGRTTTTRSKK
mmetsp:Transcript_84250/g.247128  ORF Transcript_84250/g.247128 Transcript_84250/m.247128 type:complete len:214 (-) Transcript_84250:565-1206(-)